MRITAARRSSSLAANRCQRVRHVGIDDDALPHRDEPRLRAVDGRRVEGETRRRVEADAVGPLHAVGAPRRAAKNSDNSRPHSSARTPPVAVA